MVDKKRIETLKTQIASYEEGLSSYKRLLADLNRFPANEHRDRMIKVNQETIAAITRSLQLAQDRLRMYEAAPRLTVKERESDRHRAGR